MRSTRRGSFTSGSQRPVALFAMAEEDGAVSGMGGCKPDLADQEEALASYRVKAVSLGLFLSSLQWLLV